MYRYTITIDALSDTPLTCEFVKNALQLEAGREAIDLTLPIVEIAVKE